MVYYELKIPVRYYETDQMGIVHHSNYIRYFECSRSEFMREVGYDIVKCEEDGIVIPVVAVECKYRFSAKMGDILTVTTEIDKLPLAKLVVNQKVFNQNGKLCAEGKVVLGFMDSKTGNLKSCPERFIEVIKTRMNDK